MIHMSYQSSEALVVPVHTVSTLFQEVVRRRRSSKRDWDASHYSRNQRYRGVYYETCRKEHQNRTPLYKLQIKDFDRVRPRPPIWLFFLEKVSGLGPPQALAIASSSGNLMSFGRMAIKECAK